jgi:hypothetical protein
MGRLTLEERRRVVIFQQQARREMLARLFTPVAVAEPFGPQYRWSRMARTAVIVALLGGGWLACQAVEFHVPTSVVEALMPRR